MAYKRTALVTGCSDHSLGSALALALHQRGWRVFASARNAAKLTLVQKAGIETVIMDVSSTESIKSAALEVERLTGGSLDALVNNAGTGYGMPIIHLNADKMHELFELNCFSIIRVTKELTPLLLKSSSRPLIVNHTSINGVLGCGQPFQGGYAASKAAAASLTEAMRLELAPFGIQVINLCTGAVRSTFWSNTRSNEFCPQLPAESIYNTVRDVVEKSMVGENGDAAKPMEQEVWAQRVAKDLDHERPSYTIWRGTMATVGRLAALLPIGMMDGTMKRLTGLDIIEKRLADSGSEK